MTGRERLLSILHREPTDRLAWTTLVDDHTRSVMPEAFRSLDPIAFYREIGCDILQFGNYGMPPALRVEPPYRLVTPPLELHKEPGPNGREVHVTQTPWGELTATYQGGRLIEYPVTDVEGLRILTNLWRESRHEETPGTEDGEARLIEAVGEDGIYVPTVPPSPVQRLLEYEMGLETFYFLLQDHPREMADLLDVMHACRLGEYEILARRTEAVAVIAVENTSSTMISPDVYRQYSLPQVRDFVDVMHQHGKKAILHMCGHLKALLPAIGETGLDGIHALTPPPVGDVPFEEALDVLGADLVMLGGVFDPSVFHGTDGTPGTIRLALDRLYTPRVRGAHLLLWVPADGIPTPVERFLAVGDWMRENGPL